jgi:hypothetical protein
MNDLKKLSTITTRYKKEGVVNPVNQKYDFKKPTIISMSKQDMETLHQDGTLEKDGITIVYEK